MFTESSNNLDLLKSNALYRKSIDDAEKYWGPAYPFIGDNSRLLYHCLSKGWVSVISICPWIFLPSGLFDGCFLEVNDNIPGGGRGQCRN